MGIYCYPRFSGLRRASGGSLPSFHVTLIRKGSDSCRELHQNHTDGEVVRTDKTRVDGQIRTRTSFSLLSQTRKQTQYIKHSSLCPTPRTHLPAINGAYLAATKEGVPPPSVCSLPRQHLAPRCQMSRTRGQEPPEAFWDLWEALASKTAKAWFWFYNANSSIRAAP